MAGDALLTAAFETLANSGAGADIIAGTVKTLAVAAGELGMVGGQVLEVACRMGERVQKGEVLLRVDSASAIDAREAARATLRQAEDAYRRVTEVHGAGGVTEQQLIEVETKLAQARSMAAMAERRVENCVLRSPSAGVVGEVHVTEGPSSAY